MEELIIYVNGKKLKKYPITQDEYGKTSHKNSKYADGTPQYPLDFGNMKVGYEITLNDDCVLVSQGKSNGNWIIVTPVHFPKYKIMFVHVDSHFATKIGTLRKAGKYICKIASKENNGGFAVHLHVSSRKKDKAWLIRKIIFPVEALPVIITTPEVQTPEPELSTAPTNNGDTPTIPSTPTNNPDTAEPTTEPSVKKTLLEIILQFFTDLFQRFSKSG